MKILMIGSHPKVKGGITSVISQLLSYDWNEKGIVMKFLPSYSYNNNIMKILFFIFVYFKIIFHFIFFRPDICHMHMSYKGSFQRKYIIQRLFLFFKIKNIIHLHGSEFEKYYNNSHEKNKLKINKMLKECDAFIVLGSEWKNKILKIEPTTKIIVINNSIKLVSNKITSNVNEFNILFLGVLIERKGVTDLLKSLKILNEENLLNDYNINLFIAGDGPQKQELMKLSGKWGIKNYIKFIGWVDQQKKEELLLNSQLFVLPSYNEGLPIAILEAINYGVPIISTNVGSIDEAVIHNKNGFIINPGDSLSLSKYIKKIVTDNILWEELSYSSKEICKDKFNETEMFNRLCELYSRCVHEI